MSVDPARPDLSGTVPLPPAHVAAHFEALWSSGLTDADADADVDVPDGVVADRRWGAVGVAVTDDAGTLTGASPALSQMTGWPVEHQLGRNVLDLVHPDDHGLAVEALATSASYGGPKDPMDLRIATSSGGWVRVAVVAHNRLDDPALRCMLFEVCDAAHRSEVENLLAHQGRILELVARGAPVAEVAAALVQLVEVELAGSTCWVAAVGAGRSLLRPLAASQRPAAALLADVTVGPEELPAGVSVWRRQTVIVDDVGHEPLWARRRDDAAALGVAADWAMPVVGEQDVLGVIDVLLPRPGRPTGRQHRTLQLAVQLLGVALQREDAVVRLRRQARRHPVTGLPNRLELDEVLLPRAEPSRPLGLVVCDLVRMDAVIRAFGHGVGDDALTAVAGRLDDVLRSGETLHHIGDHTFAVVVEQPDGSGSMDRLVRRLGTVTEHPIRVYGRELLLDLHMGVAASSCADPRLLLEADVALSRQRETGRPGATLFEPQMFDEMLEWVELEAALRQAIEQDRIEVHYQPKIDLATGEVVGAEALARWRHPRRGPVGPAVFVPVLEASGLIVPVGLRILERACQDAVAWPHPPDRPPLTVAVNVSVRQLQDPDFADRVRAICDRSGLAPHRLVLEVTETLVGEHHPVALATLDALDAHGIDVSVDDFGTGYSSLVRLGSLPVSEIKIERAFTCQIEDSHAPVPLVDAIVALGHGLGIRIVAEGVETPEQLHRLRALGCHQAQGFLFGAAAPGSPVESAATRRQA